MKATTYKTADDYILAPKTTHLQETEHLTLDYHLAQKPGTTEYYYASVADSLVIKAKDTDQTLIAYIYYDLSKGNTYIKTNGTNLQDYIYTGEMYTQEFVKLVDEANYIIGEANVNDKFCEYWQNKTK